MSKKRKIEEINNNNCNNCYESDPIEITSLDSYLEIMSKCNENSFGIERSSLPKLKKTQSTPSVISGIKASISILKVRKNTYITLVKSLFEVATDRSQIAGDGIYCNNNKIIIKIKTLTEEFDVCNYGTVFEGAKEDEEEEDNYDEQQGGGLTRKEMQDKNPNMLYLDICILKIIIMMFIMSKSDNSVIRLKAITVLQNFIVVSSVKEYLDIGQLYAIIKPTVDYNKNNGWDEPNIIARVENYLQNTLNTVFPTKLPRKSMIETIDGTATRIAASQNCPAYCNFSLKTIIKKSFEESYENKLSLPFYIDNKYAYYIGLLTSDDVNINAAFDDFGTNVYKSNDNDKKMSYENLKKIRDFFKTIKEPLFTKNITYQIIDYMYFALNNSNKQILEFIGNEISRNVNYGNKNVILIKDQFYYCASVACFLYQQNNHYDEMLSGLITCNFDSLCHDNGHSKYYRLIMILVFILKNDTQYIKKELEKMDSPSNLNTYTLDSVKGQYIDVVKTKINEKIAKSGTKEAEKTALKNVLKIIPILNQYFNALSQELIPTSLEHKIFCYLAMNSWNEIENKLYVRLLDKSCYVFGTASNYSAIVNFKNSANSSFTPAQNELKQNNNFSVKNLNSCIMYPYHTNCAVDAPLKHERSLVNAIGLDNLNSSVWVTAVTIVDAASQIKKNSYEYTEPICIPINVENLSYRDDPNEKFNFTYKYIYGNIGTDIVSSNMTIQCPTYLDTDFCNNYNRIFNNFELSGFYYKVDSNVELKNELSKYFKTDINPNDDNTYNFYRDILNNFTIRDAFSKLIEKAIFGKTTEKNPTAQQIKNAKEEFKIFLVEYINNVNKDIGEKWKIIQKLSDLIEITNIRNANELNAYVQQITNNRPIGGTRLKQSTLQKTAYGRPRSLIKNNFFPNKLSRSPSRSLSRSPSRSPSKFPNNAKKVTYAQKTTYDINQEISDGINDNCNLQLSYSTIFGKYGFEIGIDKNGEYVLNILNTQEDYNNYLAKYGLNNSTNTDINMDIDNTNTTTNNGANTNIPNSTGGKKYKTKKQKHKLYKTRKLQKRLNKRKSCKKYKKGRQSRR